MTDLVPTSGNPFDSIRRIDDRGEYWTGRDLMPVMDYSQWRDFAATIERAKAALILVQGGTVGAANFADTRKVSVARGPAPADYRLTRLGAYLVAMAGDDAKEAVAEARIYFAVRTRQAETTKPPAELTRAEILRMALDSEEQREALAAEVKVLAPKANYVDAFVDIASDCTTVRDFSHQLQVGEKALRDHLMRHKVIYRTVLGTRWSKSQCRQITEYSWHAHADYKAWFHLRDQPEAPRHHNGQMRQTLYVSPPGKVGIAKFLRRHPIDGAA